jgi:hypothetical protein
VVALKLQVKSRNAVMNQVREGKKQERAVVALKRRHQEEHGEGQGEKQERRGGIETSDELLATREAGARSRNAVVALKRHLLERGEITLTGSRNAVVALKLQRPAPQVLSTRSEAGTPWWH